MRHSRNPHSETRLPQIAVKSEEIQETLGGVDLVSTIGGQFASVINIDWHEVDTPGKLCGVVWALSGIDWGDSKFLYRFMTLCAKRCGYEITVPKIEGK